MAALQSFIDWFFALGSTVFVPIIMFILCMIFRGGFAKSIRSALYMGIGLAGLNLIINYSVYAMTPVADAMTNNLGLNFSVIDIGYGNVNVAWSWPGVILVIIGIIVINLIMIMLKWTKHYGSICGIFGMENL